MARKPKAPQPLNEEQAWELGHHISVVLNHLHAMEDAVNGSNDDTYQEHLREAHKACDDLHSLAYARAWDFRRRSEVEAPE